MCLRNEDVYHGALRIERELKQNGGRDTNYSHSKACLHSSRKGNMEKGFQRTATQIIKISDS